jgi:hypothetical protein
MSAVRSCWPAIGLVALLAAGCIAPGGYGSPGVAPGYDYYEPYGNYYGGWGPGFAVGPFRDRGHDHDHDHDGGRGGGASHHAFRAAPAGRATPSIPSGSRGGGGHSGSGRR